MKNVQIILDSACDMQKPEADALGVTLLPLRTNFGGEVFLDGVTMTHDEFFEKLTQAKTLPTTSQIPPFDFEEAFRRLHAEGSGYSCHHALVEALRHVPERCDRRAGNRNRRDDRRQRKRHGGRARARGPCHPPAGQGMRREGNCGQTRRSQKAPLHHRPGRYAGIFIPRRQALENERDRGDITEHQAGPDRQRWAARRPWKGQRRKAEQQFFKRGNHKARRH